MYEIEDYHMSICPHVETMTLCCECGAVLDSPPEHNRTYYINVDLTV